MAKTRPKEDYRKVIPLKRWDFLRLNMTAGRRQDTDLTGRRQRFYLYQMVHLPPLDTQQCYLCSKDAEHWHHIVPLTRGGDDCPSNFAPLCLECDRKLHRISKIRSNRKERPHVSPFKTPPTAVVYVPPENKYANMASKLPWCGAV